MVGIAVATTELSTAAVDVAIMHATNTSLRRVGGACVRWIGPVAGESPSSGTGRSRYGWDAARFLSSAPPAGNLHDSNAAVLSRRCIRRSKPMAPQGPPRHARTPAHAQHRYHHRHADEARRHAHAGDPEGAPTQPRALPLHRSHVV